MTPQQTQAERSRLLGLQLDILKQANVQDPSSLTGDLLAEYNDLKEQRRILAGGKPQGEVKTATPTVPPDGTIIRNKTTGERQIYRNGKPETIK
jgi:hypothetical protein